MTSATTPATTSSSWSTSRARRFTIGWRAGRDASRASPWPVIRGRRAAAPKPAAQSGSKTDAAPAGRALKLEEALGIAIQIADALDQAHQHGVIHRDLKPANVMLVSTGSGSGSKAHVKLLDFGLAKLTRPADAIEDAKTVHSDLTGPGVILGTVRYMAPEQIEGRAVDARTDIFAFGVVLYEMLTGRKAFDGKTQASLIAAIMNVDPHAAVGAGADRAGGARSARDAMPREGSGRPLADACTIC